MDITYSKKQTVSREHTGSLRKNVNFQEHTALQLEHHLQWTINPNLSWGI